MKVDNTIGDWGQTIGEDISINFSSGAVGDVTLTVLHEASHAALGGYTSLEESREQHQSIYNVEYSYMVALQKFGVQFSSGNFLEGEYDFVGHVVRLRDAYGCTPEKQVPISEIIRRWTRGVKTQ